MNLIHKYFLRLAVFWCLLAAPFALGMDKSTKTYMPPYHVTFVKNTTKQPPPKINPLNQSLLGLTLAHPKDISTTPPSSANSHSSMPLEKAIHSTEGDTEKGIFKIHISSNEFNLEGVDELLAQEGEHIQLEVDYVYYKPEGARRTWIEPTNRGTPLLRKLVGDTFLKEQDWAVLSIGWQTDILRKDGKRVALGMDAPSLKLPHSHPQEIIWAGTAAHLFQHKKSLPLSPSPSNECRTADVDENAILWVRKGFHGQEEELPRSAWSFSCTGDEVILHDDKTVQSDSYYRLKYKEKQPITGGLSFLAISSISKSIPEALIVGASQTGRLMNAMLAKGVQLPKALILMGGSQTSNFHNLGATPGSNPLYAPLEDKALNTHDLAKHSERIIWANSSIEYARGDAHLLHQTPPPDNARVFHLAGSPHYPIASWPPSSTKNPQSDTPYPPLQDHWTLPSTSVVLIRTLMKMLAQLEPPPDSIYPTQENGGWVELQEATRPFPELKGVRLGQANPPRYLAVDETGNARVGVRMPAVAEPLGTYTGWALINEKIGHPGDLLFISGSFIPQKELFDKWPNEESYLQALRNAFDNHPWKIYFSEADWEDIRKEGGKIYRWVSESL